MSCGCRVVADLLIWLVAWLVCWLVGGLRLSQAVVKYNKFSSSSDTITVVILALKSHQRESRKSIMHTEILNPKSANE